MSRQSAEGLTPMEKWLLAHPYLAELARLQERIDDALRNWVPGQPIPQPDFFEDDLRQGTPVLASSRAVHALAGPAAGALRHLVATMSAEGLPEQFSLQLNQLKEQLEQDLDLAQHLIEAQLAAARESGEAAAAEHGFVRFFCWKALEKTLRPWRSTLERQLEEAGCWELACCPLCGTRPAMAQLVRTRGGRKRLLACSSCMTRWEYRRIGCPYCGNDDHGQLAILEQEDEPVRLDVCHCCQGFLKTCTSERDGELMLADWSTLHLDALGMQQGYRRLASSLYGL